MGSKMVPHRGLPVLGTRRQLRETQTPQGRTDSELPFEGYINARLLGQMVKQSNIFLRHPNMYHVPFTMYNFIKLKQVNYLKRRDAEAQSFFEHGRHKRNGIRTLRCLN